MIVSHALAKLAPLRRVTGIPAAQPANSKFHVQPSFCFGKQRKNLLIRYVASATKGLRRSRKGADEGAR